MSVEPTDRPLAALRDETIDRLVANYGHGHLSLEAFERRLDRAMEAETHEALLALTRDLQAPADSGLAARRREALDAPHVAGDGPPSELLVNVFGGTERGGHWRVAREIRMVNVFGGCELDFSEASFTARTTRIKAICIFGGAELHVPEGVNTVSRALCLFGGIEDRGTASASPDSPTLVLEGFILFGGVSIRIKRTFRERMVEFANSVRSMFGAAP